MKSTLTVASGMVLLTLLFMSSVFAQVSVSPPRGGTTAAEQAAIAASTAHPSSNSTHGCTSVASAATTTSISNDRALLAAAASVTNTLAILTQNNVASNTTTHVNATTAVHGLAAGVALVGASGTQTLYGKTLDGDTCIVPGSSTVNMTCATFTPKNIAGLVYSEVRLTTNLAVNQASKYAVYPLVWDTYDPSSGSGFSGASFTAPVSGVFNMHGPMIFHSTHVVEAIYLVLNKNGVAYKSYYRDFSGAGMTIATDETVPLNWSVRLSAGDVLSVSAGMVSNQFDWTLVGGTTGSCLFVEQIR